MILDPQFRQDFEQRRGRMIVGAIIARAGLPDSARSVLDRTRDSIDPELDPEGDLMVIEAFARTQLGEDALDKLASINDLDALRDRLLELLARQRSD